MPNMEKRLENLKKANEESHSLIVESLKSALYELLETKEISEIRIVDLTRKAGVSRGGFYRNFYLVTDVLKDDIKMVADDVRHAMGGDIGTDWEIILDTVYRHRKKIPLLLKAGMGFEILDQINRSIDEVEEKYKLRVAEKAPILKGILDKANTKSAKVNLDPANFVMCSAQDPVEAVYLLKDHDRRKPLSGKDTGRRRRELPHLPGGAEGHRVRRISDH